MDTTQTEELASKQRKLDAFLVDNQELEALNARLASFNLFNVLRIQRAEIRHSNVLAWLLTPGETHGLGSTFLRRFLSRLLLDNEDVDVKLTPAQIELSPLSDIEVFREWKHIDVLARSPAKRWCLLIENKVLSSEAAGSLPRYLDTVNEEMPGFDVVPVYLTLEGDDPSEEGRKAGYIPLSHVQVLDLLDTIVSQNEEHIPDDARTFLHHYMDTLRRLTMQDDKLIQLCKTIYTRHREAVDLIVEYGVSSQIMDVCEKTLNELEEGCEFIKVKGSSAWFLPTALGKVLPREGYTSWPFLPRPAAIMYWFYFNRKVGKIQLTLEVGPAEKPTRVWNGTRRFLLLKLLKSAGFSFGEKAFKEGAKYTRLHTETQNLRKCENGELNDDPEYIAGVFRSLWKKHWKKNDHIVQVLKDFDWKAEE